MVITHGRIRTDPRIHMKLQWEYNGTHRQYKNKLRKREDCAKILESSELRAFQNILPTSYQYQPYFRKEHKNSLLHSLFFINFKTAYIFFQ